MASEQFSLCWDNFHKNMSSGMNSLLENEDLVDVTLAVEGKYLKAHKMVLSVCSPYFRELFKTNPCKHPIVFMKDVSYVAMSDLLQFMYQGEVQVSQENLTTFIKTAEALQVKGLTGDGNGSAECDNEAPEEPKAVEPELPKLTTPRAKKVHQTPGPAVKRPRLSAPTEQVIPTTPITKTEPIPNTPSNEQLIQFKMEPYDQGQSSVTIPDDNPEETFTDDPLDDTNVDDTNEDYSMMEAGDEEPQAGTSTDGTAGEGQDARETLPFSKKCGRSGIIVNGFTYHQNTLKKGAKMRYLVCAEYKRLTCKARAQIPVGGTIKDLILRRDHNHPPYQEASIRDDFLKIIKTHIECRPTVPLKEIYECASILHPEGAELCPFKKIAASMRRWRQHIVEYCEKYYKLQLKSEGSPPKKRVPRMRFVVDGFVYHNNVIAGTPPLRYLGCAEHKRSGCRGRATIPVGGTLNMLKMTQPHNHPPDVNAEEKDAFVKELKNAVRSNSLEKVTLKKVYETVAEVYPKAAEEISFRNISSSLHRWRRNPLL